MKLIKSTLLEKDQKQLEMRHKCKKLAVQHVSHLNEQSNTCSKVLDTFRFPINSYEAVPSCTHFGIISSLNIHQTVKVFCFIIQSLLLMLLNLEFSETHKYSWTRICHMLLKPETGLESCKSTYCCVYTPEHDFKTKQQQQQQKKKKSDLVLKVVRNWVLFSNLCHVRTLNFMHFFLLLVCPW